MVVSIAALVMVFVFNARTHSWVEKRKDTCNENLSRLGRRIGRVEDRDDTVYVNIENSKDRRKELPIREAVAMIGSHLRLVYRQGESAAARLVKGKKKASK
jgi:hypothetical protein